MKNTSFATEALLIGREHWDVPLRVDLRAYLRFNRRMDSRLRRLVIHWAHAASPWSRGVPQKNASAPPVP